ncbi:MAG: GNAT family N-acetyltransferase [Candidatus Marinimicrobia bacterium]|nr:GNAT family N-acetyltransferase [Candidatus Neomarinimicrobiota bacterium]MBL7059989.1 GNAT family N-acetyltransferase [Candidatus Neomarinimicrobiota bacterium]
MDIIIKVVKTKSELEQAFEIRRKVFIKEQNVPEEIEMDEFDVSSRHIMAIAENNPVGTARWRKTKDGVKFERFTVLKTHRGLGIGTDLVRFALNENRLEKHIYLNAQEGVIYFYKRFGFVTVGKQFFEAGIPHRKMVLKNK